MTTQTNEAAERLIAEYIGGAPEAVGLLDGALAAERRATVERIIGLLHAAGYDDFDTLLEEVAE